MSEREAFEAWAESAGYQPHYMRDGDEYRSGIKDLWECWQARAPHGEAQAGETPSILVDRHVSEWPKEWADALNIPQIQSLLYDLGLLPEQLEPSTDKWRSMLNVIFHVREAMQAVNARAERWEGTARAISLLVTGLRERAEQAEAQLAAQQADAQDAERYRWLRKFPTHFATEVWGIYGAGLPLDKLYINNAERLDAAINAALQAAPQQEPFAYIDKFDRDFMQRDGTGSAQCVLYTKPSKTRLPIYAEPPTSATVEAATIERLRMEVPERAIHDDTVKPDEPRESHSQRYFWRVGWNACRETMFQALALQPAQPQAGVEAPMCCATTLHDACVRLSELKLSQIESTMTAHDAAQLALFQTVLFLKGEIKRLVADVDQEWDRNAERLTREAGICGGHGINMNATTVDELFDAPSTTPALEEAASMEHLRELLEAVRVFRNEPMLGALTKLRGTQSYHDMTVTWKAADDFIRTLRNPAPDQQEKDRHD